jgi:hypothetical protein
MQRCMNVCVCMYACLCVCVHVYACVCVYVWMYVCLSRQCACVCKKGELLIVPHATGQMKWWSILFEGEQEGMLDSRNRTLCKSPKTTALSLALVRTRTRSHRTFINVIQKILHTNSNQVESHVCIVLKTLVVLVSEQREPELPKMPR